MVTKRNLERELKKRGWEKHLDFAVAEFEKGKTSEEVFKSITDKDSKDFVENLENPKTMFLPQSYLHNESEVIIGGKEKNEGHIEVKGNAKVTLKCHAGQHPFKNGNAVGCINDPEEHPE